MYWKLFTRMAQITATLCALFGAYQVWVMATGDYAGGRFGLLASQRDLVYVGGLVMPLAAFASALTTDTVRVPPRLHALALSVGCGALVLLLMMGLAPLFETVMMRAALFGTALTGSEGSIASPPTYTAQGWWHWWGVYAAGIGRVAEMLGMEPLAARPFWRTAGLLAWAPMYVSAAAVLTTLLGFELASGLPNGAQLARWRLFVLVATLQAALFAGWKCARILSIRFDVPPESTLALLLVGPGLLLCGVLLQGALRPFPTARDA